MTVKILVYTVKARLCYSCCLPIMSQIRNKNDKPLYFIILIRQLIVTGVAKLSMHEYCSAKHEWQLKTVIIRN